MLKKIQAFASKMFGKKATSTNGPKEGIDIRITSYSQPHVLGWRMKEEGLTHDGKVLADLKNVRIENMVLFEGDKMQPKKNVLFFCPVPSGGVRIKEVLQQGDGGELPDEVKLIGLKGPDELKNTSALYHLSNVILHSNGVISITPTPETKWELADRQF